MLALRLTEAAAGDCHFVTNTRILVIPTCDIGPSTIDALTEDPGPSAAPRVDPRRRGGPARPGRTAARPLVVAPRDAGELERRLELEQQERITAVARRLSAERQRDLALRERDAAVAALAALRAQLEAAEARAAEDGGGDRSPEALTGGTARPPDPG
jgi:hypothetical protein